MFNKEKMAELFEAEFPKDMTFLDVNNKLKNYRNPEKKQLQMMFCDILCSAFSEGFIEYDGVDLNSNESLVHMFVENIKASGDERFVFKAINYALLADRKKCLDNIHAYIQESNIGLAKDAAPYCEADFIETLIVPIKNLIPGLWTEVGREIEKYPCVDGLIELLQLLDQFYAEKDILKRTLMLQSFILKYPDFKIPREFLSIMFMEQKMWNNAIACLEQIDGKPLYFLEDSYYDLMYTCYCNIKDLKNEERFARKVYEINPDRPYIKNNLAYCLYRRKKYNEAKELLKICIDNNLDMPYAANNYVRVLISLGQNKTAKEFIASKKYKISKSIEKKVKKLNSYDKKVIPEDISFDDKEDELVAPITNKAVPSVEQFSSEKLLEDELTARIEKGYPVFGKNLRIYKRKGVYGRQFIISNEKRLDLLCEDENGDLYIIELKKDRGYDDAYEQTAGYLEWFETNEISNGKNVYGIICLNGPSQELIDKVHNDKRMRLFEYKISYTEL